MGIDDSFHKGLKAYREGNYQEAVQLFTIAVTDNEANHKAWNALGVTYSKMGRLEESVTCYENALKYDPGNTSYEQNRNQIVQKALSRLPPPENPLPVSIPINYQRFIIPSILLVFVVLITLFVLFASSSLWGSEDNGLRAPLEDISEVLPVETLSPSLVPPPAFETDQSDSAQPNVTPVPDSDLVVEDDSAFIFIGDFVGKYNAGLSEITFTIAIPSDGIPQYLPRVTYLWSAGTLDPIHVLPANPASGTIKPGDTQKVTLQIPGNQQPRAGEKYRLEIRPVAGTGLPVLIEGVLPANYNGGVIPNPKSYSEGTFSGSSLDSKTHGVSDSTAAGVGQNLVLDGPINGYYTGELEELTFSLTSQQTGSAQDLSRIEYILTVGSSEPVTTLKSNPAKGTINPGEKQLVTVRIPEGSRPRAGDIFTFEIKPDVGPSIVVEKILSSAYQGGTI